MTEHFAPICLHPENPHYFLFRGKPTLLFTSAEHYSMAINRKFDYIRYLDTLQSYGFNHSRVYTGIKRERPGEHAIDGNTLAISADDYVCPWKRTSYPGAGDGGCKFDLTSWDDEYFERIRNIVRAAGDRDIELEIVLNGPLHAGWDGIGSWGICPLNRQNNINNIGDISYYDVFSEKHPALMEVLDRFMEKLVYELNEFDNIHFECMNEPYTYTGAGRPWKPGFAADNLRIAWQTHVAELVARAERQLPNQHMISSNYYNGFCEINLPIPHVDLYSFHYANPMVVSRNTHLKKAIGMNETGMLPKGGSYIRQAWMTVLGGIGLYNMLDYSFSPGYEDGSYELLPTNPNYAGEPMEVIRQKLKILKDFITSFDFIRMRPATDLILYDAGMNAEVAVLAEENRQYAVYQIDSRYSHAGYELSMGLKASDGVYRIEIIDPDTGAILEQMTTEASDGYIPVFRIWDTDKPSTNIQVETAIRIQRC